MIKKIALIGLVISTLSLHTLSAETPPELKIFIDSFCKAVNNHNKYEIMGLIDPAYKAEQHDRFLEGRTDQFIMELFCGNIFGGDQFQCVKLKKIKSISLMSLDDNIKSSAAGFRIVTGRKRIDVYLTIKARIENGKTAYGIVGGVG